ncbi:Glucan 1,3-beta-glucosidase [Mycena venus]|uniref:Glucan 1,3-beta-glucosidase n=1 Tax=Mycena venus TaxID=2733690 RepID=A0A8H6X7F0_9AGAR|nr:Glucan 1,3-beta-glucosidase [Mycena venus]
MASAALPPAAPYAAVPKPWTQKSNPRSTFSYYLTSFGIQSYFTYLNVRIDGAPLCLVFSENFNAGDDAAVFGSSGSQGRWLREMQMDGFGNGEFEMTTSSSNNSFLLDGNLYLLLTLTQDSAPFPDGTTYNATDCTFNITAPNGVWIQRRPHGTDFDWSGYFTACSRTTNHTAGTIINPVQSARVSTLISAKNGDDKSLMRGSIRYSKVEVRAKMPTGDWLWPAIWMLPVPGSDGQGAYGAWPRSGEIDLVESRGNGIRYTNRGSNYVQGALNWGPTPQLNGVGKSYSWWTDRRTPFSNDFHTYTMEWTDKWLHISVDTPLHTLLDMQFNEPFWQRRDFPKTLYLPFPSHTLSFLSRALISPLDHRPRRPPRGAPGPWANATNKNAAPFDQGEENKNYGVFKGTNALPPLRAVEAGSSGMGRHPASFALLQGEDGDDLLHIRSQMRGAGRHSLPLLLRPCPLFPSSSLPPVALTLSFPPFFPSLINTHPLPTDFYLIKNVAVGGTNGWFPDGQGNKPWLNHAGNPMADFASNKGQWLPTWPENVEDRAMVVDYVKMWKHCGDP